ncbi:GTPase [Succinimonas sp.]|uniref:GTPase n=1 Tax=Succinimonas sp. TaxID=1936151 RepID=UPI00386F1329
MTDNNLFSDDEKAKISSFEAQYSGSEVAGKFWDDFKAYVTGLPKASVLILGGSGAGKSTLVNLVFNSEIAKAGSGRPVTKGIELYKNDLVNIYDSEGYEFGEEKQQHFENLIFGFMDEHEVSGDPIDVIWYCISIPGARVVDTDINVINRLNAMGKPVAVVFTQADQASEEQSQSLQNEVLSRTSVRSDAIFESTSDRSIELPRGIKELYEWTRDRLPESRKVSFMGAARRDMAKKSAEVDSMITKYTATAFGIGAVPIPVPSAAALVPLQMKMLSEIAVRWNVLSIQQSMGTILTEMVTTTVGRTIAASLLKLFPGVGTVLGGAINGGVAAAVTFGTGKAFNYACRKMQESDLDGTKFDMNEFLKNDFVKMAIEMAMNYKSGK